MDGGGGFGGNFWGLGGGGGRGVGRVRGWKEMLSVFGGFWGVFFVHSLFSRGITCLR